MPSRMVDVAVASAASVVMPSKHSPGPSPYIGVKWSNPHAPVNPSRSAVRALSTTSAKLTRCWAMSRPNLIPVLPSSCALLTDAGPG